MGFASDTLTMWRDDPEFCQRFEARISADRRSLHGRWEKRTPGSEWEHDFDITDTRP